MSQDHFISNGESSLRSWTVKLRRCCFVPSGRHFFRWLVFVSCVLYFLYFTQLLVYTQQWQRHQQQLLMTSSSSSVKIDRSRCCVRPSPMVKDVCGRVNCTDDCPDPVRLPIDDDAGRENAFFLETSGSGTLNIRQACAVESLAHHNPSLNVNVLFVGGQINASSNTTQKLAETYTNLRLIAVNLDEYLAGTALEKWYHCTDWRTGPYHVSHLSDGLRFLTLNKFGGYYFDLDVLIVKSVINYRNFVAVESKNDMGSGVIHADMGSPLMKLSVQDFADNYSAGLWTHNGPVLLFRVLKSWCNVKDLQSMDYVRCHGFHVLPQTSFCPVHYTNLGKLFDNHHPSSPDNNTVVDWLTDQVVGIHTWNKLSYNRPIYKNSTQTYARLARHHCPLIYSMAPDVF